MKERPTQLNRLCLVNLPVSSDYKSTSHTCQNRATTRRAINEALMNVILIVAGFLKRY
jgi:hypothetical protein